MSGRNEQTEGRERERMGGREGTMKKREACGRCVVVRLWEMSG